MAQNQPLFAFLIWNSTWILPVWNWFQDFTILNIQKTLNCSEIPLISSVGCSIQCQAAGLGWGIHLSHFYSHALGLWNLFASRCILNFQTWVGWWGWKPNFYFEQAAVKPKPTKSPVWAAWRPWTSVRMVCCFSYPRGSLGYKSYITIH